MKRLGLLLVCAFWAGCAAPPAPQTDNHPTRQASKPAAVATKPATKKAAVGTVLEVLNAAGYTYVKVQKGNGTIWAAAPEFTIKVGDQVYANLIEGMPMDNYTSKTLGRTFDRVYFVSEIFLEGENAPADTAGVDHSRPEVTSVAVKPVRKATAGYTVEEICTGRTSLTGKKVQVRGRVTKYSAEIMGTNWIHLQDGTGTEGSNDLTVTTMNQVEVGDLVLVEGTIIADKDFGYGYKYDVILEDATVTIE